MDIKTNTSNQIECTIQDSTVQTMEHRLRHSLILHMYNMAYHKFPHFCWALDVISSGLSIR